MADELSFNLSITVDKTPLYETITPGTFQFDVSAIGLAAGVQVVGTSAEAIVTTDVASLGWCYLQNLDSTNFILYGPDDGGTLKDFGKMLPGEIAWLRLKPGITVKAKADTASCKMLYKIFDA